MILDIANRRTIEATINNILIYDKLESEFIEQLLLTRPWHYSLNKGKTIIQITLSMYVSSWANDQCRNTYNILKQLY